MMRTLNWKRTGWSTHSFILSAGQEIIGQLNFSGTWNHSAVYTDKQYQLNFVQKNFLDSDVMIVKDGKTIGLISRSLLGEQTLQLATGEKFFLTTGFWEQEAYWKNENNETIISYRQATMSSMEKGAISLTDFLTDEVKILLTSAGLFARQLVRKRIIRTVAVMLPVIAAATQF